MADRPRPHLADTIVAEPNVDLERTRPSALPVTDLRTRYNTLSGLGEGGMGEVWLLRDTVIGRDIAMKAVRQELQDDGISRTRFLREARIQGQLEHPSIVPVYDLGIGSNGQPYFTMRRVRGRTLDDLLRDTRSGDRGIPFHTAITVMSRVCLAVDFAHTHGVFHRDIKPSNIMVGDWGEVYVLDWGIAKLLHTDDPVGLESRVDIMGSMGSEVDSTTAGALLGTPGYMSPEQAQSKPIDARSDVYALGAVLFELLSGEPLHTGMSVPALVRSTITGADAHFSKRFPNSDIPLELEAICVRATQTEPAARFDTARAMHEAIERFLEGDRDLELRRKRSVEHARAAKKLARKTGTKARATAMHEVGRALALDPDNRAAMRTMVALLTDPPKTLPKEVEKEMKAELNRSILAARKLAGIGFLTPLGASLLLWSMGILDWRWFIVTVLTGVVAAVASIVPKDDAPSVRRWITISSATLGLFATSRLGGAFIALPVLSFGLAIGLLLFPRAFPLRWAIAVGCFPIVLPLVLERLGVVPPIYEFAGDTLIVHGQFTRFPETMTLVYLLVITLAPIAAVCVYLARIRERADQAHKRLRLMAWQLRQIVPKV